VTVTAARCWPESGRRFRKFVRVFWFGKVRRDVYRIVAPASEDVACGNRASVQEQ